MVAVKLSHLGSDGTVQSQLIRKGCLTSSFRVWDDSGKLGWCPEIEATDGAYRGQGQDKIGCNHF